MTDRPALLAGTDFEALFSSFESTAFRLETRESYYERDELEAFQAHGPSGIPGDFLADWYALIRDHVSKGREIERVRVVSEPHSDYTRFGLWLSSRNVAAGERINYLQRSVAKSLSLPDFDYWLFDDSRMYIVRFEEDDSLLGAEPVMDEALVASARSWRDIALSKAVPRDDYAQRFPLQ